VEVCSAEQILAISDFFKQASNEFFHYELSFSFLKFSLQISSFELELFVNDQLKVGVVVKSQTKNQNVLSLSLNKIF
jgi:hypothetical protein